MQAISSALQGLHQAEDLVNRTASNLARPQLPTGAPQQDQVSLSDNAVALLEAKASYMSNLDTIKVADEMQKSTLSLIG